MSRISLVPASVAVILVTVGAAFADPYKWCAVDSSGGGTNCGFVTIEQCRATVSGQGGFCEPKQVVPPNLSPAAKAAAPKTNSSGQQWFDGVRNRFLHNQLLSQGGETIQTKMVQVLQGASRRPKESGGSWNGFISVIIKDALMCAAGSKVAHAPGMTQCPFYPIADIGQRQ